MSLNIVKKVRVKDEEHSKRVQDALFDEGYFWTSNGIREYKYTDKACIFAEVGTNGKLYLLYSDGRDWDDCSGDEYFLVNGKLVDAPPASLNVRPAEEIKALHKAIDVERFFELHSALKAHVDQGVEMPASLYMEYTQTTQKVLKFS